MGALDPDSNSNVIFEYAPAVLSTPSYLEAQELETPEERIRRLDTMQSPSDRLKELFINTLNPRAQDLLHEALWIRSMAFNGFMCGLFYGGILTSQGAHADYQRQHNADVFEGRYRGNRHFWDTLITRCAGKGLKYGFRTSLLTGLTGFISLGSITYRNKLYLPDWILGFTTVGCLSRLWLGSKAVAVGGLCGFAAGLIGYGVAASFELAAGRDVTYFRATHHAEWLQKRDATLRRNQLAHQEEHMKYIDEIIRGPS